MKRNIKTILVILGIFIIILLFTVALLYNYNRNVKQTQYFNKQYESYYQKEILGTELATLLNKAMDYNEKSGAQKDDKDLYYLEDEDTILVEVKFFEKKKTYTFRMEDILSKKMENFINFYATASFKCTKIEYHEKSKKVKSLYFEQVQI